MSKFVIAHQTGGTTERPTYYRLNMAPPHVRVESSATATVFETEDEAQVAVRQLGLENDHEISVKQLP